MPDDLWEDIELNMGEMRKGKRYVPKHFHLHAISTAYLVRLKYLGKGMDIRDRGV